MNILLKAQYFLLGAMTGFLFGYSIRESFKKKNEQKNKIVSEKIKEEKWN